MKRQISSLSSLFLIWAIQACTGYGDLIRECEGYRPPEFYRVLVETKEARGIPSYFRKDEEFEAEIKKIKEMKDRWEKAIMEPRDEGLFYMPDSHLLKELLPCSSDPSKAQEMLSDGFSLETLEILAFLRNPAVKAAEKDFRAALESYSQVWNLDEIIREYSAFMEDLMTAIGPMGREEIEMKFPFPGVLALKGEIVNKEVMGAREGLEIARRTAITMVRKAYWDLLYIHKALEINQEMIGLLRYLETVAKRLYETGKTGFQDLLKIKTELEIIEEELISLKEERHNMEVRVLSILNLPPDSKIGIPAIRKPERLLPDPYDLYPIGLDKRQELRQLREKIGKMEKMIEMAETEIYPLYSLGFSFFKDEAISQVGSFRMKESFETRKDPYTGAGLPKMPWYGKNDAYIREARQKLAAMKEELKKMEDETVLMVREAWFRFDRARREEALYADRVVTISKAALEVSRRGYETGTMPLSDVISSYMGFLRDRLTAERKRMDMGIYRAELEEALGCLLK